MNIKKQGFSFLELIVVLVIISIIVLFIIPNMTTLMVNTKIKATKTTMKLISDSIKAYYQNEHETKINRVIPLENTDNILQTLKNKNYINKIPKDAWNNEFKIYLKSKKYPSIFPGNTCQVYCGSYSGTIISAGNDKKFGTNDDIIYYFSYKTF